MLILKPRDYKLNGEWSLIPKNKIDTVNTELISNEIPEEDVVVETVTVNTVSLGGEDVSLPIANDVAPTHYRLMYNVSSSLFSSAELAKSRVECVMVSGTNIIKTDDALDMLPVVKISLKGTSSVITRGQSTYTDYPECSDINNVAFSLATWIQENKLMESSMLTWDYGDNSFSMNPWVRKIIPMPTKEGTQPALSGYSDAIPSAADILTRWTKVKNDSLIEYKASWYDWTAIADPVTGKMYFMLPPDAVPESEEGAIPSNTTSYALRINDIAVPIKTSIEKISKYTYSVNWTVPVRFAYLAASRIDAVTKYVDIDNWAFVDNVTDIEISLLAKPFSTETITTTRIWDDASADAVTADTIKSSPINISGSELFTQGTLYDEDTWAHTLSKLLLQQYKDGKYIIEVTVRASWALRNNVRVNTQLQLYLPDGSPLRRHKNSVITFEVKNIEKSFDQKEFVFILKLMEV